MVETRSTPVPLESVSHTSFRKSAAQLKAVESWLDSNPQQALILALEVVRQLGDDKHASLSQRRLRAQALTLAGRGSLAAEVPERAIPSFLQALACYNPASDLPETIPAHLGLGVGYMELGIYPEALQHLMRALSLSRNLNEVRTEGEALNHLGRLYQLRGDMAKSFAHLEQALELTKENALGILEADIHLNLCSACRATGHHQRAIQSGLRSVEIFQKNGHRRGEARALNALGEAYLDAGDYQHAMEILQLTAEVTEKNKMELEFARALRKIGILHDRQERSAWAIEYINRALEISREIKAHREQAECCRVLAEIYKKSGEYRLALENLESYYSYIQAAFDAESDRRLKTIEIIHQVETARKDAEIYQLRNVQLQQEIEERKKAQKALEHLATQDPLTGLANRRHFLDLARRAFIQARRYSRPLTAVMIDIDQFKHINDTFGHKTGDKVLSAVAAYMQEVLRKVDILGRFGGDEFVILLPETNRDGAMQLVERLRNCLAHRSEIIAGLALPVTLSIGIAAISEEPELTLDTLLQRADQAMYLAKQAGRNRAMVYPLQG